MASLQCPKCGIRHNYGTHCAFCGEMLESAPQTPSPQHAAPAPFSHVAEQAPNTSEIANPDVKDDNNYLAPELPQSGVMVQNKHPLRLVLIVLVSCLALASIIFALNYPFWESLRTNSVISLPTAVISVSNSLGVMRKMPERTAEF